MQNDKRYSHATMPRALRACVGRMKANKMRKMKTRLTFGKLETKGVYTEDH
jgi:hypothetical protein